MISRNGKTLIEAGGCHHSISDTLNWFDAKCREVLRSNPITVNPTLAKDRQPDSGRRPWRMTKADIAEVMEMRSRGLSFGVIARKLGRNEETVRGRWHRERERIEAEGKERAS